MKRLLPIAMLMMVVVSSTPARADAVLAGPGTTRLFPTQVDVQVHVRAQIEATTHVLALPPVETAGDYTLTVPPPDGGFAIGVDIDRGDGNGFVAVPITVG